MHGAKALWSKCVCLKLLSARGQRRPQIVNQQSMCFVPPAGEGAAPLRSRAALRRGFLNAILRCSFFWWNCSPIDRLPSSGRCPRDVGFFPGSTEVGSMTAGPLCSRLRQLGRPSVAFRWAQSRHLALRKKRASARSVLTAAPASDALGFCPM